MKWKYLAGLFVSIGLLSSAVLQAEESGFLSSYEGVTFALGESGGKIRVTPGLEDKISTITKIMIDQPEIFIADGSKYKGMKPADALAISEALRKAITQNMTALTVVDEPGPDVAYLRIAITDVHLKKKKRRLLSYTPVGLAITAVNSLATSDIMKKIDLKGVTIEGEGRIVETGDYLGSIIIKLAPVEEVKSDEASWENLLSKFDSIGKQIDCRFRNSKAPKSERVDCKILESYREN